MGIEQAFDFLHATHAAQFESLSRPLQSDPIPSAFIITLLGEEHP